jgi:Na+/melibiose symporter-like transporter
MMMEGIEMTNNNERLGFKTYFGTTFMGATQGLCNALMTSLLMLYLTDYSGIGAAAAIIGSSVLVGTRFFDAVNDPLQGWIMDKAKFGRLGKYKPFMILSIILLTIGTVGIFFLPESLAKVPALACVWVIVFYITFDFGNSFYVPNVIFRTITLSPVQRSKLTVAPRFLVLVLGVAASMFIMIVRGIDQGIGNMHTSFGLTVLLLVSITTVLSLAGIACVKEKYSASGDKDAPRVKLMEIFSLIVENKALRVRLLSMFFDGFIWTFIFAASVYYTKWAYCADLATGAVDTAKFGTFSMIGTLLTILPIVLGTLAALPLMKRIGSPLKIYRALVLVQAVGCGGLFVFQLLGILSRSPALYFALMAIPAFAIGISFVPGETINMECMDYEIYQHGKDRSALCNAVFLFITKLQSAIAAAVVGVALTLAGYIVDSKTDTFIGDLSTVPSMLNGFVVIMGLIPSVCALVSWFIQGYYPVTDEIRADMQKVLGVEKGETL